MKRRAILALLICSITLTFAGCQIFGDYGSDTSQTQPDPATLLGFSEQEKQEILAVAKSEDAALVLPSVVPAMTFYRFDIKNELGAHRLSTIVSYDEACKTPSYGPESTAKVLLYETVKKRCACDFDYFAFAKSIPQENITRVVNAMAPYLCSPEFLLRSSQNLEQVPAVIAALEKESGNLMVPPPGNFVAAPVSSASMNLNLKPRFSSLGDSALLQLIFNSDLRNFFTKLQNEGTSNSSLITSNVTIQPQSSLRASNVNPNSEHHIFYEKLSDRDKLYKKSLSDIYGRFPDSAADSFDFFRFNYETVNFAFDLAKSPLIPLATATWTPTSAGYYDLKLTFEPDGAVILPVIGYSSETTAIFHYRTTCSDDYRELDVATGTNGKIVSQLLSYQLIAKIVGNSFTKSELINLGSSQEKTFHINNIGPFVSGETPEVEFLLVKNNQNQALDELIETEKTKISKVNGLELFKAFIAQNSYRYTRFYSGGILESREFEISMIDKPEFKTEPQVKRKGADGDWEEYYSKYRVIKKVSPFQLIALGKTFTLSSSAFISKTANIRLDATNFSGKELTYSIVTPPQYGTIKSISGNVVTYVPLESSKYFPDYFTFKVSNGTEESIAKVLINYYSSQNIMVVNAQGLDADGKDVSYADIPSIYPYNPADTFELNTIFGNRIRSIAFDFDQIITKAQLPINYNVQRKDHDGSNLVNYGESEPSFFSSTEIDPNNKKRIIAKINDGISLSPGIYKISWPKLSPKNSSTFVKKDVAIIINVIENSGTAPLVSTISPNTFVIGTGFDANVSGSNFTQGAWAKLTRTGSEDIVANSVIVNSSDSIKASFPSLDIAAVGNWNLVILNTSGKTVSKTDGIKIVPPAPTIAFLSPNSGLSNESKSVTISGTNFVPGALVKLVKDGQTDVLGSSITVVSDKSITCTFDLNGKSAGNWNLVVTNSDNQTTILNNAFSISLPAPTVTSVSPATGSNVETKSVTISGTNFVSGASVKLTKAGQTDIAATNVTVVSATSITCSFDLNGKTTGNWNLVVSNSDSQSATLNDAFSISLPAPTVTSVSPATGSNAETKSVTISGTNFVSGAFVKLTQTGQTDIAATNVTVVSATSITCSFDLNGKTTGNWNLVVSNSDDQSATLNNGFSITSPVLVPAISTVSPSSANNNGSVSLTITGTNFVSGASAKLTLNGQSDIAATNVTVVSATSITCSFDVSGKATGNWSLIVTNTNNQSGNGTFTISQLAPTLMSISPNTGLNNETKSVTITGTNFLSGVSVKLTKTGEADILGSSINLTGTTSITCSFDLNGKATGGWNLIVTNTDSQAATLNNGFTIELAAPTVSAVSPATGINNTTKSVTITGTNFVSGVAVKLTKTGEADITGTSVSLVSATSITCSFDLTGKAAGNWNLVVTNSDNKSATLPNSFVVTLPAPALNSMTPSSALNNGNTSVTISGINFVSGATVKLSLAGQTDISATNVSVVNASSITCSFALTGKATGNWTLTVTNPDNQSGIAAFAITQLAPTLTSVSPNTGLSNETKSVTIAGANFVSGITARLTKTGETDIVGSSLNLVSANSITCSFDLNGKAAGNWDLVVTNSDNQSANLSGGFSIELPAPTISAVSPVKGPNNTSTSVTVSGANFASGIAVKLTKSGEADISGTSVNLVNSTSLTCSFDLSGKTVGDWNLVVTNTDSKTTTLSNGFAVTLPAPAITSTTPASALNNGDASITISGINFVNGATVKLTLSGQSDVAGTNVSFVNATTITCDFALNGKTPGAWNLVVTNPDSQSGSKAFSVNQLPPALNSINPANELNNVETSTVNISGINFVTGATVKMTRSGYADILPSSVTFNNGTSITAVFNCYGKVPGAYNFVVVNSDGQTSNAQVFNIQDAVAAGPTLSGISPNSGNTSENKAVSITGTGFFVAATVKLVKSGEPDIVGTNISVPNPTNMTCSFDLTGKATGAWNLVLTNPDTNSATINSGFTISNP